MSELLGPAIMATGGVERPLFVGKVKGSWRITLVRKSEKVSPSAEPLAVPSPPPAPTGSLLAELIARGVSETTAEELVACFPADYVATKIEVFDWLVARKDKRASKSPGGYLADSIRRKYAIPKDFKTQTERIREEDTKRSKEREDAEIRRREREQVARDLAERGTIQAYLAGLTEQELETLDQAARAEADPEILAMELPALAKTFRIMRREPYVRRLLESQGKLPVS